MKTKILIIVYFLFYSCNIDKIEAINPIIKTLSEKYDTTILFEKGRKFKRGEFRSFIKLKVYENDFLKQYPSLKIPASFIGVYLIENLKEIDFNQLQIDFYNNDNNKLIFQTTYQVKDLKRVINKKNILNKIKNKIVNRQYHTLFANFSSEIHPDKKEEKQLISELLNQEKEYGLPESIEDHGYVFGTYAFNGKEIPYVGCISLIKRKKAKTQLILLINQMDNTLISIRLYWS